MYICIRTCDGKLVDIFITNQTSHPYKTPSRLVPTRPLSIFTIVFPVKSEEASSKNNECRLPFPTF